MKTSDRLRALAADIRARAFGKLRGIQLAERVGAGEAVDVGHMRATRFFSDGTPDPSSYRPVDPVTNEVIP